MLFFKADIVTQSEGLAQDHTVCALIRQKPGCEQSSVGSLLCQLLSAVWQRLELLLWPGEKLNGPTLRYQRGTAHNHQQHGGLLLHT